MTLPQITSGPKSWMLGDCPTSLDPPTLLSSRPLNVQHPLFLEESFLLSSSELLEPFQFFSEGSLLALPTSLPPCLRLEAQIGVRFSDGWGHVGF